MKIENRRYIKLPTSDNALEALCKVALTKHSAHTLLIKLCTAADKTETAQIGLGPQHQSIAAAP